MIYATPEEFRTYLPQAESANADDDLIQDVLERATARSDDESRAGPGQDSAALRLLRDPRSRLDRKPDRPAQSRSPFVRHGNRVHAGIRRLHVGKNERRVGRAGKNETVPTPLIEERGRTYRAHAEGGAGPSRDGEVAGLHIDVGHLASRWAGDSSRGRYARDPVCWLVAIDRRLTALE